MPGKMLTKSKYMSGLQCPRCMWIKIHKPEQMPEPDETAKLRFAEGNLVGNLAKKVFPKGIDIPTQDFTGNIEQSKKLIAKKKTLFEPAIVYENLYSRMDILKTFRNKWDIIEVKSTTRVKKEHIYDVAFQKYCCEKAGLTIRKCSLMHLNKEFVKKGRISSKKLFVIEDITEKVEKLKQETVDNIKYLLKIVDAKKPPKETIGSRCKNPYMCDLCNKCWKFLPEHHVFCLYRGGKKSQELLENGILAIKDIPKTFELTEKQMVQKWCEDKASHYIDKKKVKEFLKKLKYPLYMLDFETYNTAIPLYKGLRSYQHIPFQFSLHIIEKKGSKPIHHSFLAKAKTDPRPKFAKELKKVLGNKGTIVVFNQSFEKGILRQLAEFMPKYKKFVIDAEKRIEDLLLPFREFHYYHPKQKGSASIKKVLPALCNKNYDDMEIGDGGTASSSYAYTIHG
ncbi:hypothetical protein CL614_05270, partial [archaeon]|nr:hypothetical protein [archaeon]